MKHQYLMMVSSPHSPNAQSYVKVMTVEKSPLNVDVLVIQSQAYNGKLASHPNIAPNTIYITNSTIESDILRVIQIEYTFLSNLKTKHTHNVVKNSMFHNWLSLFIKSTSEYFDKDVSRAT